MEILRMLNLSTSHITTDTTEWLGRKQECFVVYPKAEYGWFIFTGGINEKAVPRDLKEIIEFAKMNDCDWVCIDRDGETVIELPIYDW